jgi:two-component system, NarL family, sensor histidine kinase UhpB
MVAMIAVALGLGGIALKIVSPDQFEYENAQQASSVSSVAVALNAVLAISENPRKALDSFVRGLGPASAVSFQASRPSPNPPRMVLTTGAVPRWFVALLNIPELGAAYPIFIGKDHVGDLLFTPDLSPDVFEKYIGFLAIVLSGSALMVMAALSAYFTTGTALRPLAQLQQGLTRMRQGNYDSLTPVAGPPEIRKSCVEANQLASTLKRLSQDNRDLMRKLVSVQDDERHELGRELHDELGPLLFAIRANATALSDVSAEGAGAEEGVAVRNILEAAESLQLANRRILEGLSPLYVQELGLEQSIRAVLRHAQSQAPHLKLSASIDHRLNDLDGLLLLTTYRVIQEAVTNVLRHAKAGSMDVDAAIVENDVAIEIADDGVGFPPDRAFGRGLTGMHERVRALNGTLALLRENGRTVLRCRLPIDATAG